MVHAGLSQLLLQLKVLAPSRPESSLIFLNNNSLIVTHSLKVAMVDGNHGLCNISKRANKISKKTTSTELSVEPAKTPNTQVKLELLKSTPSQNGVLINLKPPLLSAPPPWLLKLTPVSSNYTRVVSSTVQPVELNLTTLSPQLVMALKTESISTSLETPGVPHGVTKDTLESLLKALVLVSAVSNRSLSTQPSHEKLKKLSDLKNKKH